MSDPPTNLPPNKNPSWRLLCNLCGQVFRNQSGLTKHRRTRHAHSFKTKAAACLTSPIPAGSDHSNSPSDDFVIPDYIDIPNNMDDAVGAREALHGHPHINGKELYFSHINILLPLIGTMA
jgi:hypothetical protein